MKAITAVFQPDLDRALSKRVVFGIILFQLILFLVAWGMSSFEFIPRPREVLGAFHTILEDGLLPELFSSLRTFIEALLITFVLSLLLSYLSVLPVARPFAEFVATKSRFFGITGFLFFFMLIFGGGHSLKVALMVFGMTTFFVTSMVAVIGEIPQEEYDYARTLRMSEWRVVFEVVVLGKFDQALEILRQNAAMGWMMLTMVEGIVRSEGGIGVQLINADKHFKLSVVAALQVVILLIGICQDYLIGLLKNKICPYANGVGRS